MFAYIIAFSIFLACPVAVTVYFVVSLIRFLNTRKENKELPGSILPAQLRNRKIHLIQSSLLFAVLLVIICGIISLATSEIAYM